MKERPICLTCDEIRTVLNREQTKIKKPIKLPTNLWECGTKIPTSIEGWINNGNLWCGYGYGSAQPLETPWFKCRYGAPGDRLRVKETYAIESCYGIDSPENYPPPFNDGRPILWEETEEWGKYWSQCHYKATDQEPELAYDDSDNDDPCVFWSSPAHHAAMGFQDHAGN